MSEIFSVRRPALAFGAAEIHGLSIARDSLQNTARAELQAALAEHGVVCVRLPSPLLDDELRQLVQMIGPIKDPIARTKDGGVVRYSDERQTIDSGYVLPPEQRKANTDVSVGGDDLRPGLFQFFHTDDSYTEEPAAATVLHARQLPQSGGGNTCFIDMRAAYTLLEPELQRRLIGLCAVHAYNNHDAFPPRPAARGPLEAMLDVAHPVVRRHPVNGRPALYFDLDRATHIEGVGVEEGRALLQSLQDHAERNAPRYDHVWQKHDVLIWDNVSVQHRASGDFPVGEPRRFWRYMVSGSLPQAFT
jgi:alpha-ketoglutarate-dependent taurine dioxygenase